MIESDYPCDTTTKHCRDFRFSMVLGAGCRV